MFVVGRTVCGCVEGWGLVPVLRVKHCYPPKKGRGTGLLVGCGAPALLHGVPRKDVYLLRPTRPVLVNKQWYRFLGFTQA